MYGSCDIKRYRQICNFGPFFAVLTPWNTAKPKFWKKSKSTWRYYHFIYKYHKWRSYDVCFLRYGAQGTEFVFTLGFFLPFYSCLPSTPLRPSHLTTQTIKIFKKWKTLLEISSFYTVHQNLWSDEVQFLSYGMQQTDGQMDRSAERCFSLPFLFPKPYPFCISPFSLETCNPPPSWYLSPENTRFCDDTLESEKLKTT